MEIIDGKKVAAEISNDVYSRVQNLIAAHDIRPILCDVLVGSDPVSVSYVNIKKRTAEKVGLEFLFIQLPESASTEEVISEIIRVQKDKRVCGLIVQLPLPEHINKNAVLGAIDPRVDVDCISPESSNAFYAGDDVLFPPTAGAVMHILDTLNLDLEHKNILVVGQGELVGRPVTHLLQSRGLSVHTADKSTKDLVSMTTQADVLIAGTGKAHLITEGMVKKGAVIIDAGTSESGAGIVGDVNFKAVSIDASYITPVPGGVGPVTVAKLLENVVSVAERQYKR